jgi:hypothetical protein
VTDTKPLPKPPRLGEGEENSAEWVLYLQQMLNYFYQMQVVPQNGEFDHTTRHAVAHLRGHLNLSGEAIVDDELWKKLGVDEEQVEDADVDVTLVAADEDTCWAAAFSMILAAKGEAKTVDELCGGQRRRSATEARNAASELGFSASTCYAGHAGSWSGVLKAHGALWVPMPSNDQHVIVVAGIRTNDSAVEIHPLDPLYGNEDWLAFDGFREHYGISEEDEIEVLAAS